MINIVNPLCPKFVEGEVNVWSFVQERNPELIESIKIVKNGSARKIYARQCIIEEISGDLAKTFFDLCHTKGHLKTSVYIGLFYNGELVQVVSFGKSRFNSYYEYEIIRMATCLNTVVVGGASKILNYFFENFSRSLHTYAEKMLGGGNVYKELGFQVLNDTKPGYFWYKDGIIVSRHDSQKHKLHILFDDFDDHELKGTETSIMTKRGFVKVFDLGNTSWGINPLQSSEYKFNYVYMISRPSIDDKFYIGIHSTNDLNDGYMGSGVRIRRSIKKHGIKNHVKQILEFTTTRLEALQLESKIVNDEMLMNEKCMNLTTGGCSSSPFNSKNFVSMINEKFKNKHIMVHQNDVEYFINLGWVRGSSKPKTMGVFYKFENDDKVYRSMELPPGSIPYVSKTTKNYKWIKRAGVRHLVPEDKILSTDVLCPEDCSTNLGKKRLFKNGIFKYFTLDGINSAISDGWSFEHLRGGPSSSKVEIIKNDFRMRVDEDTAFNMIKNDGWSLARKQLKTAPEQVIRVAKRLGMRIPVTKIGGDGYINPPKPKNKKGSSTGKFCVKKDGIKKMVSREDAIEMIKNEGWQLGAASCWRLASDAAKQLGRELGYEVE